MNISTSAGVSPQVRASSSHMQLNRWLLSVVLVELLLGGNGYLRIPLMADSDSIPIADSVPDDGGHAARVS
jgi:hypothetical protein